MSKHRLFLLAFVHPLLWAQPIQVYSEFQRIDPFGRVVAVDRGGPSREILSPMLPRNAFTCFRIALTTPKDQWFTLYLAQNPDDAVKLQLYKELFTRAGDSWVPDRIVPLTLPYQGKIPDLEAVEGQTAMALLLEVWVAADAPVRRIRLEAQLNLGEDWIIYPMELRIMAPVVPNQIGRPSLQVPPAQRADTIALTRLRQYVCAGSTAGGPPLKPDTPAYLLDRSALQDIALARSLREEAAILRLAGASDSKSWCGSKSAPASAEWYLRFRDHLLRGNE